MIRGGGVKPARFLSRAGKGFHDGSDMPRGTCAAAAPTTPKGHSPPPPTAPGTSWHRPFVCQTPLPPT